MKVCICDLEISPCAEAEVDRIENGRFPAITRTDKTIDPGSRQPDHFFDAAKILNRNLANAMAYPVF
jgi:hypothetical protein